MDQPSEVERLAAPRFPLIGVAVHVRSLYNIGAIFRASDAARAQHLHLCGGCGHPGTQGPRIEKTALGTTETVPWTYTWEPLEAIAGLQSDGITVIALETTLDAVPLGSIGREQFPLALVVGHETDGLPEDVLAACDLVASISTYGLKQSLNVALAYGVAMLRMAELWAGTNPSAPRPPGSGSLRPGRVLRGGRPAPWRSRCGEGGRPAHPEPTRC